MLNRLSEKGNPQSVAMKTLSRRSQCGGPSGRLVANGMKKASYGMPFKAIPVGSK